MSFSDTTLIAGTGLIVALMLVFVIMLLTGGNE